MANFKVNDYTTINNFKLLNDYTAFKKFENDLWYQKFTGQIDNKNISGWQSMDGLNILIKIN
jgi:hypothetical protein